MSREELCRISLQHGANVNQQGGIYVHGHAYSFEKKLEVAAAYNVAVTLNDGNCPNISEIHRQCNVSRAFIKKIENELKEHERILRPSEIQNNREGPVGPGSRSLDEIDAAVILFLYLEEPSRCLTSYVEWLEAWTGAVVSESTVSRFFYHAFPYRGGFCRPNLVPFDKFRPENIERAIDYIDVISRIAPERLKFGDEKHLKGDAIFNRKVRRNPLTGEVPEMLVTPDFRNRYNLTGFCSINPLTTENAVWCSLNETINDADQFALELELAIQAGFLGGGDVLVLDNATVHTGKENTVLQEYLWETYGIFLLFLPARAPEWNPIEQVWKCLVQRLKKLPLSLCREVGQHATAYAAIEILSDITHDEVRRFYVGSGSIQRE